MNIGYLADACGFGSASALRAFFRKRMGVSMTEWRARHTPAAALSGGREIASTATTLMIRQLIEVPAPTLGLGSTSTGAFSLSVGNAVRGARYQVYRTTSLAKPFEPWGAAVEAKADGLLDFAVETDDSPSAFFKVEPVK